MVKHSPKIFACEEKATITTMCVCVCVVCDCVEVEKILKLQVGILHPMV